MDCADGGWTVVNKVKVDGTCQSPEKLDNEATPQRDETMLPRGKDSRQSNAKPNATFNSRKCNNKQSSSSSFHHEGQERESQLPMASQGVFPQPSTISLLDSTPCIPRTAESIVTLLKTAELFPSLRENEIDKWVQVCEHYRDKAYSGEEVGHLEHFRPKRFEGEHPLKQTTNPQNQQDSYNQQDTPDVEYRQSQDM